MFGVGLLLGIGLGCSSHCQRRQPSSHCRRSRCGYTEYNSCNRCHCNQGNRYAHGRNYYDYHGHCKY